MVSGVRRSRAGHGSARAAVTRQAADLGAFRAPKLRNVELRRAFMHNGRFTTLEEVVDFYDRGGDFNAPNKPPRAPAADAVGARVPYGVWLAGDARRGTLVAAHQPPSAQSDEDEGQEWDQEHHHAGAEDHERDHTERRQEREGEEQREAVEEPADDA